MKRRTKQWLLAAAESVFWIAVIGLAVYLWEVSGDCSHPLIAHSSSHALRNAL